MSEPTEREYLEGLHPDAEEEYELQRTGLYKLSRLGEGGGDEQSFAEVLAWLGFPTCPTCGGNGKELDEASARAVAAAVGFSGPEELDNGPCPDCTEGVVITDELVEAGIRGWYQGGASVGDAMRGALAAVVTHLKQTQDV